MPCKPADVSLFSRTQLRQETTSCATLSSEFYMLSMKHVSLTTCTHECTHTLTVVVKKIKDQRQGKGCGCLRLEVGIICDDKER